MKTTLLCLFLCFALAFAAAAADVSGKWSGTFAPDNGDNGSAYVILKQNGATITGSGGPDENAQWPGLQGKVDGNQVTFEVKNPDDGMVYKCSLSLSGDHLDGEAVFTTPDGQSGKAKLNLTKVKE
ncbi:MAG TPA: hypothetical protein VMB03_30820 [Bryobacteraceae bacterium]|nr:hypothetical protein [Bryobacteraceae bacterium]